MTPQKLDAIFPWFVLSYGFIVTFVLNQEGLMKLADQRMDQAFVKNLQAHRRLAFASLIVGALWTLQNLWIGV
jgi:hypothetical protein